jgi:anaerobic selenocysteine-containing dehydrogenase
MPEIKKASCLFCSLQCGFGMEMDRDVPVRIDLDTEAPQNKGALCVRGHYNLELLVHPRRLLAASVSRRRVPWPTALTKVATGIRDTKSMHGGDAIAIVVGTELSNEDYDAAVAFAREVLGTRNIAVAYDGSDYPFLMGGGKGDAVPSDLDGADCFVLIGDLFWGHPCLAKRVIAARHAKRSNRIYTLNPFRTNTDWFADVHCAVRPGTEPLVLAAILSAMNVQGAPRVDVERAAKEAGVPVEAIRDIAKDLKEKTKVVVAVSSRLGDSVSAYLTAMLAAKLAHAARGKYAPFFRGGNAVGAFERVGSARTVPEILKDVAEKRVKALLAFGPDLLQLYPGVIAPDSLEGLSLLASSAIFENDITKQSDVTLPQTVWTEMAGAYSASLGVTNTIFPIAAPQGDARAVGEALKALAEEFGVVLEPRAARGEHPPLALDIDAALAKLTAGGGGDGVILVEAGSPIHRWDGTITGRMSFAQAQKPYCEAWIGEKAAHDLGIEMGASVALSTDRGETRLIATVTDRMPGGLVAVPSYVPDARGLFAWVPNAVTRWYDVTAGRAKVAPEA